MKHIVSLVVIFFSFLVIITIPACEILIPATVTSTKLLSHTDIPATTTVFIPSNRDELPSIGHVVAKVKPAVVAIDVIVIYYDFFGRPYEASAAGSGWIIEDDGYIVTNYHVVEDAQVINITLQDGRVFTAQNVAGDSTNDLAVIKINAEGLPVVGIGDSSILVVGEWVTAVGNSLGMGISATVGIVSALDVILAEGSGQDMKGLIQTDAAINFGNSGGPLVNMAGQVVGINSAKIAETGVEGMGYAISINKVLPIIDDLIASLR